MRVRLPLARLMGKEGARPRTGGSSEEGRHFLLLVVALPPRARDGSEHVQEVVIVSDVEVN